MQSQFFDGKLKFSKRNFKGLSPSITPSGKRKFVKMGESMIPIAIILSTEKRDCENYLFKDYH